MFCDFAAFLYSSVGGKNTVVWFDFSVGLISKRAYFGYRVGFSILHIPKNNPHRSGDDSSNYYKDKDTVDENGKQRLFSNLSTFEKAVFWIGITEIKIFTNCILRIPGCLFNSSSKTWITECKKKALGKSQK